MRPLDPPVVSLGFICFRLEAQAAIKALYPRTAFAVLKRPPDVPWLRGPWAR
jgi:hypothetical protein